MFQKEGAERTGRDDRILAAYLAFIGGVVNSAGFVVLGASTSHVTGNFGRLADQVALGNGHLAVLAGATVFAFFAGATATGMAVESRALGTMSRTSAFLLLLEAALIGVFVMNTNVPEAFNTRQTQAMLLSAAMGVQNALVTRLSGAVVRTTHLTGIVTDLGIECAAWFRYWRSRLGEKRGIRLTVASAPASRPSPSKSALLATVVGAFGGGSVIGAVLAIRYLSLSLLAVVAFLCLGAIYALAAKRSLVPPSEPRSGD